MTGTTEPRYFFTSSGCSRTASEIEQKMTPAFASSSLKVVTTETRVEHRVDGDRGAPCDAGQDLALLQRDAELLVGLEQLRIDLVEALRARAAPSARSSSRCPGSRSSGSATSAQVGSFMVSQRR